MSYWPVLSTIPDPGSATALTQAATHMQCHSFLPTAKPKRNYLDGSSKRFCFSSTSGGWNWKQSICRGLLWAPLQGGHDLLYILVALVFLGMWKQYSSPSLHHLSCTVSPSSFFLSLFPLPLHHPLTYSPSKPFPQKVTSQCVFESHPNNPP